MTNAFAKNKKIVPILKRKYRLFLCLEEHIFINIRGNSAMVISDRRNVLTRRIGAVQNKGKNPQISTVKGVFLHKKEGNVSAKTYDTDCLFIMGTIRFLRQMRYNSFKIIQFSE